MVCNFISRNVARRGSTLAELSISIGVGALVLIALASIYLYSSRTFVMMGAHIDLDMANRLALDKISQEIRQADGVTSVGTNQFTFLLKGAPVTLSYVPGTRAIFRQSGGLNEIVLRDCDAFSYEIFQRTPSNGVFGFFPTANPATAKVVRMSWRCSRSVGDQFENQSTLHSAQMVMRNQNL